MSKKSKSRQKRSNRNRAQREALKARTGAESVKRPSRVAPSTADRLSRSSRSDATEETGRGASRGRGGARKERPARPPRERLGDRPVDIASLEGGFLRKVSHVPGGLQVIMTVVLAVIVAVLIGNAKVYKAPGAETPDDPFTMTVFDRLGTVTGVILLGLPIVATLVALAFSLHPQRRRVWTGSAVVIFVGMLLNPIVLMNFLVVGGFLIYAAWRSRRIEDPPPPRRPRRGRGAAADDVDELDDANEATDANDVRDD